MANYMNPPTTGSKKKPFWNLPRVVLAVLIYMLIIFLAEVLV